MVLSQLGLLFCTNLYIFFSTNLEVADMLECAVVLVDAVVLVVDPVKVVGIRPERLVVPVLRERFN